MGGVGEFKGEPGMGYFTLQREGPSEADRK